MRVSEKDVRAIQACYPQIYLACHTRHPRSPSTEQGISANDSMILGHLETTASMRAGDLAKHLGVVPSTLSATIKRLARKGYLVRSQAPGDRRVVNLRLSAAGAKAMQGGSVLETRRVAAMLGRLTVADRERAIAGLALLARASGALNPKSGEPR
jgi:DNA-binding MarR family transcriptional regulator